MTDQEINRAVAEARGAIIGHTEAGDIPARWPDVANDPADRSELFDWLASEGWEVLLVWLPELGRCDARVKKIDWQVFARSKIGGASDPAPGRALALAFLKAVQP